MPLTIGLPDSNHTSHIGVSIFIHNFIQALQSEGFWEWLSYNVFLHLRQAYGNFEFIQYFFQILCENSCGRLS